MQFSAHANPSHPASLLALFPLAHHSRGCIGISLSVDGLVWSPATPLTRCVLHGERAADQPAGVVPSDDGSEVYFYIHERVPDLSYDETTPAALAKYLRAFALDDGGSGMRRYAMPCGQLAAWSREQLELLGTSVLQGGRGVRRARRLRGLEHFACAPAARRRPCARAKQG